MYSMHPGKWTWNPTNGVLEDDVEFLIGQFFGSMLIIKGVLYIHGGTIGENNQLLKFSHGYPNTAIYI